MKYVSVLLIFVPISIIAALLGWDERLLFFTSALGIVPLAWILGKATEELTAHTTLGWEVCSTPRWATPPS